MGIQITTPDPRPDKARYGDIASNVSPGVVIWSLLGVAAIQWLAMAIVMKVRFMNFLFGNP